MRKAPLRILLTSLLSVALLLLRVVPTEMDMQMHMFGLMYAPNVRVTLMGMLPYKENSMRHITYAGPMGTNVLGELTTESSGIGDLKVSALIGLGSGSYDLIAGLTYQGAQSAWGWGAQWQSLL